MRFRRHLSQAPEWKPRLDTALAERQRYLLPVGAVLAAILVGYLIAALFLFPAPMFVSSATVPRVLGVTLDSARVALERVDLKSREAERVPHPRLPAGQVVWQDPPPGVVVSEGSTVDLSLSAGPQRVPVPDVSGFDAGFARMLVEAAGLAVAVESTQTAAPRGITVNTRPPAGAMLGPTTRVTLVVSRGAPTISVPNLAGFTLGEARGILEQSGLNLGTFFSRTAPEPPGTVIEQRPPGGTLAAPGTRVDVVLARAAAP